MFDTTKDDLVDFLKRIEDAKIQLPDFQRDYVWTEDDVHSLIASVGKGFPIGALLTLETGGEVHFKPRLIEGVPEKDAVPEELLLDGQQRMTSLYQAMYSERPIKTTTAKKTVVERYYYVDMKKAIEAKADLYDSIIGIPSDRIVRTNFGRDIALDLSSREKEYEHDLFPLNRILDSRDWIYAWRDYWRSRNRDVNELDKNFVDSIVKVFERYKLPIIRLDKSNSREAICLVFEKVNVGGKKLDAFELVTAIYAADSFDLRQDWSGSVVTSKLGRKARIVGNPKRDVLSKIANTDFLMGASLLYTRDNRQRRFEEGARDKDLPQVSCKRGAILELPLSAYKLYADKLEKGFIEAGAFLNELKIIWNKDIPYPPLIIALASVFAILGDEARTASAKEKLAQWFWSVTLGELYGSSTESRLAKDVPELVDWIQGTNNGPRSLDEAVFQSHRLFTLRSRLSAAYKGIHALLMKGGCQDFITGRTIDVMTFFNDKIDIHHIFPQDWCKKKGILPSVYNSIINKTALSKQTNIFIGGNAPSTYLTELENKNHFVPSRMDEILKTHLIEPQFLRNDDFDGFINARQEALIGLIEKAMGKSVVRATGSNEFEDESYVSDDDDMADEA